MTGPSHQRGIIIFTRFPEPGLTKTRLIPVLGPEGACRLHRELTEKIVAQVRQFKKSYPLMMEIHFSGGSREQMAGWLGRDLDYVIQDEGDLGARMEAGFSEGLPAGMGTGGVDWFGSAGFDSGHPPGIFRTAERS